MTENLNYVIKIKNKEIEIEVSGGKKNEVIDLYNKVSRSLPDTQTKIGFVSGRIKKTKGNK